MMDDISASVKRQIITQEIELYKNTRYQFQLRARVAKALNTDIKPIEDELLKIEQALDVLDAELHSLEPAE